MVSNLKNGNEFNIYYEACKVNQILIFSEDLQVQNQVVYLNVNKRITYDRSIRGPISGKVPGTPSTIKDLLEEIKKHIPWVLKEFPYLDLNKIKGGLIELGSLDEIPKIAYRLIIIAVLKLSYIPMEIDDQCIPRRFGFNLPLICLIKDHKLKHFI